jgi:CHAT domain-containing protein
MKLFPCYKKSLSVISLVALPLLVAFSPLSQVVIAQESGANLNLVAQADRKAEADRLLQQGIKQYQISQVEAALQSWEQALMIYSAIKNRLGEGTSLGNLGIAYYSLGKYDKAIEFQLQSLAIAKEIKDRLSEGQSLGNLGLAYDSLGKYDKAIEFQLQSLAIAKEIKDRLSEGQSLGNLGIAYYSLGKYEKAIEFQLQRLAITREIKDRLGEGQSLGNLGIAYYSLNKYEKAIEFQLQRLAITREIKDRSGEGQSLGNLGSAYYSLGKYEKAIELNLQRLAIAREIKDRSGEGQSLGNLGVVYYSLGKYEKAIEFNLQRLAIAREIKDRLGELQALGNLGSTYSALGKYEKAIEFHLQSLAIAREIKNRLGEGQSLGNLGIAYRNLGKYEKAIEFNLQSLAIVREIKDRDGERILLNNLGVAFNNLQQNELAILFYKQSINVIESIRQDNRKLSKDEQKSYLDTVEKTYRSLADLLLKQGRVMEALQILDLLKVQELKDYLKNVKGSERSAQGVRILDPEKAISTQLSVLSFDNSADINRQLASQLQQIPKSEINKVPDYLQQIPQGTVLLYPLILEDRLEIILFSPNTLPISRSVNISKAKLEELVLDFRTGLRDDSSEDYKAPATELYNFLIKPIETELIQAKATTILYAPDGILRYVPLSALYDGKQYLIEKYQVSNLISYTLSDFSPRQKTQPNILAGAFGGKANEQKFGQQGLPATIREVQTIASSFQNSDILTGENFSRQAIEAKFKNHNILHLATHAEFNIGKPDNSFIIFGNGDKIRLNEISDWQIPNIDLIVLSACQTGLAETLGNGVEILGFGYQVQKAGAKNAIASLWKVDDAGTQALMDAFYSELKKGDVTIAEALRRAQVSLIKSPKLNHPFYWSAFFAIGNGL